MKEIITSNAPAAIGPYSQGMIVGDTIYTSGQMPVNPRTNSVPQGITAQTEQSCLNVKAVLEAGGATLANVIKTTCFLADIADFASFNDVYAAYFASHPARSCVAVKDLPRGVLCEIEAVAVISKEEMEK